MTKEMTEAEKILRVRQYKANVLTSLAYVLADAAESAMIDVEEQLKYLHKNTVQSERMKFRNLGKMAKGLHFKLKEIGEVWKKLPDEESQDAYNDSDYFYDLIRLIIDRVGDDQERADRLKNYIRKVYKSRLKLYDLNL